MSFSSTPTKEIVEVTYKNPSNGMIMKKTIKTPPGQAVMAKFEVEGEMGVGTVLGISVVGSE